MHPIVEQIVKKSWNELKRKPNVIGYSLDLKKREKQGELILDTKVFRIYVKEKVPLKQLNVLDIIPKTFSIPDGGVVETDVFYIGEQKALAVDKTVKFRPVELGVSVGNWAITAGSLGMLYKGVDGLVYAGSNAHVLTDGDPSKTPRQIVEKRILQPGSYHGGQNEDNIVGEYAWHQQIFPLGVSPCPIGTGLASALSALPKYLGRTGRFAYIAEVANTIDFGVYKPSVEHITKVADNSLTDEPFIGHLFAGSDVSGIICKVNHIKEKGYTPLIPTAEVNDGDTVKGCSFWCNYQTMVLDSAAAVNVGYGNFTALFSDVILVTNDGTIKGGWSGSGWRKL